MCRRHGVALLTAAVASFPAPTIAQVATASPLPASVAAFPAGRSRAVAATQVPPDQARFSPGAIDGMAGGNTRRAIEAFQRARRVPVTGQVDAALLNALRSAGETRTFERYTITQADVAGPARNSPNGMGAMSELDEMAYESSAEAPAERFHMTQPFLKALNPGAAFDQAGTEITVAAAQDASLYAQVARIEVDGS